MGDGTEHQHFLTESTRRAKRNGSLPRTIRDVHGRASGPIWRNRYLSVRSTSARPRPAWYPDFGCGLWIWPKPGLLLTSGFTRCLAWTWIQSAWTMCAALRRRWHRICRPVTFDRRLSSPAAGEIPLSDDLWYARYTEPNSRRVVISTIPPQSAFGLDADQMDIIVRFGNKRVILCHCSKCVDSSGTRDVWEQRVDAG